MDRKKNEKEGDKYTAVAWFRYTKYIHPLSTCVPSFNFLGLIVPKKIVTKIFNVWKLERKKNEKNDGMNKQQQPDSSIHDTYTHCPCV